MAESAFLPVGIAMWSPDLTFLLFMLYMIRQTANERPLIPEKLTDKCRYLAEKIHFRSH